MKTMKITSWNIEKMPRRGLTLMEILASVFVLSFGLLAVLAILPFGAFQLERMNVADTSGACGRGAIQQIRMAEWQKPENLWVATGSGSNHLSGRFFINNFYGPSTSTEECQIADPFIVDPLGLGIDPDNPSVILPNGPTVYHYLNSGSPTFRREFPIPVTADKNDCLYVMSVYDNLNDPPKLFSMAAIDSYFRWGDGTMFTSGDEARPEVISSSSALFGDFSWLYMVTPICDQVNVRRFGSSVNVSNQDDVSGFRLPITSPNTLGCTPINNVTGYEVTAVVFHRRDLYPEPLDLTLNEKQYRPIRRISLAPPTINSTGAYIELTSSYEDDLGLSSIKWILLTGQTQEMGDTGNGSLVAQWYRVTGSDDIQGNSTDGYTRRVFLVGPDWKGAKNIGGDPDGLVYAILCEGVVNVFQATMPK